MAKFFLIVLTFIMFMGDLYADSPLTSTDFSEAYLDIPIVKKCKGVLDRESLSYLIEANNPIDVKLALINKIGWNHKRNNSNTYRNYVLKNKKYKSSSNLKFQAFEYSADADELICFAYLKALDDYFSVESAYRYAQLAVQKKPTSYSINLIAAIMQAQIFMGAVSTATNSCYVYKATNEVRENMTLKRDLRSSADKIIFEYMDIYKAGCKK